MHPQAPHSPAFMFFTYASFAASVGMIGTGILFLPMDLSIKGYFAMAVVALVQSCITLTKTMRDNHESGRLLNRLDDAKTEQLLMKMDRAA